MDHLSSIEIDAIGQARVSLQCLIETLVGQLAAARLAIARGDDEAGRVALENSAGAVQEMGDPRIICAGLGFGLGGGVGSIRLHPPHFGV